MEKKTVSFLSINCSIYHAIGSQYHKNHACNKTLARTRNVITTSVSTMRFLTEIMFILKPIKSHFKRVI